MNELEAFRQHVCEWLEENAPLGLRNTSTSLFQGHWGGRRAVFASDDVRLWFERASAKGWTAPGWPVEYGGGGLQRSKVRIINEELTRLGLPRPLAGFGLTMIGPILLEYGSPLQQQEHVKKIVQGQVRWCQGYSEPNAGSDLASLQMRAVRDGDHFVINGQKVWTSYADKADWMFCLVRTSTEGKKQAGITFILVDMKTSGITTRPIELISGSSPFCEVFFEDVRVPAANVIGEVNEGWKIAKSLLGHERDMVGQAVVSGGSRPDVLRDFSLRSLATSVVGLEDGEIADPLLRDAIAQAEMDRACAQLTIQRVGDGQRAGHKPGPESSIFKVYGTELNQRRWDLAMRILAEEGLGWDGQEISDVNRAIPRTWLRSRGNTIEGGSSEIQLTIIATRVLGLPRKG